MLHGHLCERVDINADVLSINHFSSFLQMASLFPWENKLILLSFSDQMTAFTFSYVLPTYPLSFYQCILMSFLSIGFFKTNAKEHPLINKLEKNRPFYY